MPRKPFNTTADFFKGPSLAFPLVLLRTQDARLVQRGESEPYTYPFERSGFYLTTAGVRPEGPGVGNVGFRPNLDWGTADVVAIPSGSAPRFTVLIVEGIAPFLRPSYWRCWLVPYPFPT